MNEYINTELVQRYKQQVSQLETELITAKNKIAEMQQAKDDLANKNEILQREIFEKETVSVSNDKESASELERMNQMCAKLETEKQDLNTKYKKLIERKKQYKVVMFLCLVVIGCVIGLFIFNKNLQSRDNQIANLNSKVSQQQTDIKNLNNNVEQLQTKQQELINEKNQLSSENEQLNAIISDRNYTIRGLQSEKEQLSFENGRLNNTVENKNSTIGGLQREKDQLSSENGRLNSTIASKNSTIDGLQREKAKLQSDLRKRPYRIYVDAVDGSDYSFKLTLYYDDGSNKEKWFFRYKSYYLNE